MNILTKKRQAELRHQVLNNRKYLNAHFYNKYKEVILLVVGSGLAFVSMLTGLYIQEYNDKHLEEQKQLEKLQGFLYPNFIKYNELRTNIIYKRIDEKNIKNVLNEIKINVSLLFDFIHLSSVAKNNMNNDLKSHILATNKIVQKRVLSNDILARLFTNKYNLDKTIKLLKNKKYNDGLKQLVADIAVAKSMIHLLAVSVNRELLK